MTFTSQSMADYVLSKATGERFYGKPKFLDLLVKTGRYIREGQKVEMSKDEALQFINAKLKELEERESALDQAEPKERKKRKQKGADI